ncbi:hypothetical protein SAMN02983009_00050 [Fusobacterium necrophorum]|nr:hypothetical protein [Fusobacterium necrophorum]SDB02320.1 hypothetical protein SAMN02983009_00050 [Fusobacterium necrophorum]SQD08640.1 Uncharacterised protein [Fusobacterium necrophorum subsp. necrophorum]
MFDTLIKFSKDREKLDFYATDKRAIHELLKREQFKSLGKYRTKRANSSL